MNHDENLTPLYTVRGKKGAHFAADIREVMITTEPGTEPTPQTVADVQYIGALLPYSVPVDDLTPFTLADRDTENADTISALAQEAVTVYGLDGKRAHRAAGIARNRYAVQVAQRDEHGETIPMEKRSHKRMAVKGTNGGWYVVTTGSCTCPDHKNGHVCKHRIAVWMVKQSIARPIAAARRVSVPVIVAELEKVTK